MTQPDPALKRTPASVGVVTSGSYGPSVERYIGIGYVPAALAATGTAIAIEVPWRRPGGQCRQDGVPPAARQAIGEIHGDVSGRAALHP